jgi:hypothetical protein
LVDLWAEEPLQQDSVSVLARFSKNSGEYSEGLRGFGKFNKCRVSDKRKKLIGFFGREWICRSCMAICWKNGRARTSK